MFKEILLVLITVFVLPYSSATLMRLEFTGTIIGNFPYEGGSPIGPVSGYYILDTSAPDETGEGGYNEAVVDWAVNWNGTLYDNSAALTAVAIRDNAGFGDGFLLAIINGGSTEQASFYFQLVDTSATVFYDTSFPTELDLIDFDPHEIDNGNGTNLVSVIAGQAYQARIESISYNVPLPGALILLSSGLFGMAAYSRRRLGF